MVKTMPSNVVEFTGKTTLDISPDKVFEGEIGNLDWAIVIGYTKDGEEYFASSTGDAGTANLGSMRSPMEATTYCDSSSPQHLYVVKTKLVR